MCHVDPFGPTVSLMSPNDPQSQTSVAPPQRTSTSRSSLTPGPPSRALSSGTWLSTTSGATGAPAPRLRRTAVGRCFTHGGTSGPDAFGTCPPRPADSAGCGMERSSRSCARRRSSQRKSLCPAWRQTAPTSASSVVRYMCGGEWGCHLNKSQAHL